MALTPSQLSRRIAAILLICAALTGCGFGISDGKLTMDFSATQIQDAIAGKFPVENCPTPITCIKLQNPQVTLPENSDRIQLQFATSATVLMQTTTGTTVVSAKPRYQNTTGELFLDNSLIQDLQMPGVSSSITKAVSQYGSALAQLTLERTPIYSFKNANAEKIAKMGIADVKVVNGKLRVIFDPTLAQAAK